MSPLSDPAGVPRGCAIRLGNTAAGFPAECLLLLLQEGGQAQVGETFKTLSHSCPHPVSVMVLFRAGG